MTEFGLNAGFGEPLGETRLQCIARMGFDSVRQDIIPERAERLIQEFVRFPVLRLHALIMGGKMPGDENTMVDQSRHAATLVKQLQLDLVKSPAFELGNEPNIAREDSACHDPNIFGQCVYQSAMVIWGILGNQTTVISGGIHNPSKKPVQFLRRASEHFPTPDEGNFYVGFHNYAPDMMSPHQPYCGFKSLNDQYENLRRAARGHRLWDTESGCHTLTRTRGKVFKKKLKVTDLDVANWTIERLRLTRLQSFAGTVIFQERDGPDETYFEHLFGLWDVEGELKPQGIAVRDYLSGVI